jgi:hypothetical protein
MDSPEALLGRVQSRDDFLRFLDALIEDHREMERAEATSPSSPFAGAANGWENTRLGSFLEAMRAWALDAPTDGAPSWRAFAQLLVAGKGYE